MKSRDAGSHIYKNRAPLHHFVISASIPFPPVEDDSTLRCGAPPVTSADTHLVDVRLGRKRYLLPKSTNLTVKRFEAIQVQKVDPPRARPRVPIL